MSNAIKIRKILLQEGIIANKSVNNKQCRWTEQLKNKQWVDFKECVWNNYIEAKNNVDWHNWEIQNAFHENWKPFFSFT